MRSTKTSNERLLLFIKEEEEEEGEDRRRTERRRTMSQHRNHGDKQSEGRRFSNQAADHQPRSRNFDEPSNHPRDRRRRGADDDVFARDSGGFRDRDRGGAGDRGGWGDRGGGGVGRGPERGRGREEDEQGRLVAQDDDFAMGSGGRGDRDRRGGGGGGAGRGPERGRGRDGDEQGRLGAEGDDFAMDFGGLRDRDRRVGGEDDRRGGVGGGRGPERGRGRDGDEPPGRLPELYSIHRAKVQSVQPFGLFVRLEGFVKHGLVHLSHVSDHEVVKRDDSDEMKVRGLASVAEEGDPVWVKVISLKQDESGNVRIGCSLKLVSQSSGKDLDPNNLKLEQQQPRPNRSDPQKVTLGAVYNVVCSRCGGHGHLRKECYSTGDKAYELLPEDDDDELVGEQGQEFESLKDIANRSTNVREQAAVQLPTDGSRQKKESKLPDTVTTVEEALAVIARLKEDKKERKKRKHKHDRDKREKKQSKMERRKRKDDGGDRNRDGKRRKKGRD